MDEGIFIGIIIAILAIVIFISFSILVEREWGIFSLLIRIADLPEDSLIGGIISAFS